MNLHFTQVPSLHTHKQYTLCIQNCAKTGNQKVTQKIQNYVGLNFKTTNIFKRYLRNVF